MGEDFPKFKINQKVTEYVGGKIPKEFAVARLILRTGTVDRIEPGCHVLGFEDKPWAYKIVNDQFSYWTDGEKWE